MIKTEQSAKRSIYKSKKIAIVALLLTIVLLLSAFFVVSHLFKTKKVTLDGGTYLLKLEGEEYSLYRTDGTPLEEAEESYFVLDSGTLVVLNKKTGQTKLDARVDTTGTEMATEDAESLSSRTPRAPHSTQWR